MIDTKTTPATDRTLNDVHGTVAPRGAVRGRGSADAPAGPRAGGPAGLLALAYIFGIVLWALFAAEPAAAAQACTAAACELPMLEAYDQPEELAATGTSDALVTAFVSAVALVVVIGTLGVLALVAAAQPRYRRHEVRDGR